MNPTAAGDAPDSLAERLGGLLQRLAREGDRALLARTVQLVCRDHDQGHVCTSLREWQQRAAVPDDPPFPALAEWRAALLASGLCSAAPGDGAAAAVPLVLDGSDRLYLLRHFAAEQQILAFLRERMQRPSTVVPQALAADLAALGLSGRGGSEPDWQLAAIAAAVRCPFLVLTGGPGTGKTTTVAALLSVLLHRQPDLRIALAAPTGKAAARLLEALRARAQQTPAFAGAAAQLQCKTLHRLLGYLPLEDTFRMGPDRRLRHDLVVVDEASMVDPSLLAALCRALRPEARLVLVGDRDQLAAIAAGQVLGDLCRAAAPERGTGVQLAAFVAQATGQRLPTQDAGAPIADCVITLHKNHRFGEKPGIGAFASALARRDAAAAAAALHAGHRDLHRAEDADAALALLADALFAAATTTAPAAALRALATVRILCAARHGDSGTDGWNRRVEAMLATRGLRTADRWYQGRPVLITQNDPQNELWNGDLGVACLGDDDRPFVAFPTAGNGVRRLAVARLPAHETAWAMTVHKAQGSEFEQVLLVMPDRPGPLWQASLVYTGVTRAQQRAIVLADPALLRPCLDHWPTRSSGLADGLAALPPAAG